MCADYLRVFTLDTRDFAREEITGFAPGLPLAIAAMSITRRAIGQDSECGRWDYAFSASGLCDLHLETIALRRRVLKSSGSSYRVESR
jgi:hypothetical protein